MVFDIHSAVIHNQTGKYDETWKGQEWQNLHTGKSLYIGNILADVD